MWYTALDTYHYQVCRDFEQEHNWQFRQAKLKSLKIPWENNDIGQIFRKSNQVTNISRPVLLPSLKEFLGLAFMYTHVQKHLNGGIFIITILFCCHSLISKSSGLKGFEQSFPIYSVNKPNWCECKAQEKYLKIWNAKYMHLHLHLQQ